MTIFGSDFKVAFLVYVSQILNNEKKGRNILILKCHPSVSLLVMNIYIDTAIFLPLLIIMSTHYFMVLLSSADGQIFPTGCVGNTDCDNSYYQGEN